MNLAICSVILKSFIKPFETTLIREYSGTEDRFQAVYNEATDRDNKEVIEIMDYIEKQGLKETFFQ